MHLRNRLTPLVAIAVLLRKAFCVLSWPYASRPSGIRPPLLFTFLPQGSGDHVQFEVINWNAGRVYCRSQHQMAKTVIAHIRITQMIIRNICPKLVVGWCCHNSFQAFSSAAACRGSSRLFNSSKSMIDGLSWKCVFSIEYSCSCHKLRVLFVKEESPRVSDVFHFRNLGNIIGSKVHSIVSWSMVIYPAIQSSIYTWALTWPKTRWWTIIFIKCLTAERRRRLYCGAHYIVGLPSALA